MTFTDNEEAEMPSVFPSKPEPPIIGEMPPHKVVRIYLREGGGLRMESFNVPEHACNAIHNAFAHGHTILCFAHLWPDGKLSTVSIRAHDVVFIRT